MGLIVLCFELLRSSCRRFHLSGFLSITWCRERLKQKKHQDVLSYSPVILGASFLVLSTAFLYIYSSFWQQRGNPRARKSAAQCLVDYAETFLGLFSPSGTELSLAAFLAVSIGTLLVFGAGTWMALKRLAVESQTILFLGAMRQSGSLDYHLLSGVSYLMARNGIGETHRFVTPIITPFLGWRPVEFSCCGRNVSETGCYSF